MKVILKKDFKSLGKKKDIVEVACGYARNFLIPRGIALSASDSNKRIVEEERLRERKGREKEAVSAAKLGDRIEALSLTIKARAQDDETLFGSVTAQDILDALTGEDVKVEKKQILMDAPIKKLGVYQIPLKLHEEVTSTLKIWVIRE